MLGMFLNRRDADAASYDGHQRTLGIMEDDHRARMASIDYLGDLDNAQRLIDRQQQQINREVVQINAYSQLIRQLVDMGDPVTRDRMRYEISRLLDIQIAKFMQDGYLIEDPRHDAAWRNEVTYVPAR